ncbi:MAG: tRNA uridine-5-carboxymethylaminomethyl(34) synthesis enzyme MnmG [Pseudomonadota bacterium]|nr:tRNA uridine-5-carboxymethylaminomethyl(34) synthesis enzyme MnmG [Pseudomonadota bacterium]
MHVDVRQFDVVVVGAGHAGCEAAAAAARLGARTAIVTLHRGQIGRLSCNPAMGGLAKGTLVREIDALGGLMGRVADATTIQFRRLNTRKGLAVQASRAQVDIDRYPRVMAEALAALPSLTVLEGEAVGLRIDGTRIVGLVLGDGTVLTAPAVVLTTGTFLGGVMHRGDERVEGGRVGEGAAYRLSDALRELGVRLGRLKTGTTPRLDGRTIDWARLDAQPDLGEGRFSFAPAPPRIGERTCYIAHTHAGTHDLIRDALPQSPLHTGAITGRGPRYCPSIEDKVVRFPDKDRHQLFLEPEGLETDRVYVNGTSTSLPRAVQEAMIRSIPGLEAAEVLQYGYAVEYDYADPTQLDHDLALRGVTGLYFAGQINGTSGYEEAAAQGLVAGVAAAACTRDVAPLRLGRDEACIGVLVDDLVTRGVGGEPYRMFPSRSEHRLVLREDNADRRLMPKGRARGLVGDAAWARYEAKEACIARLMVATEAVFVPDAATQARFVALGLPPPTRRLTVADLLRRPELTWASVAPLIPEADADADATLAAEATEQVEIDVKYAGYVVREDERRADAHRMYAISLEGLDFSSLLALSTEARERLTRARPDTLGAAARMPGITPAAIDALAMALVKQRGRAARE